MGVEQRDNSGSAGDARLTPLYLLHREADGDLSPEERAALDALPDQSGVDAQRRSLAHAAALLRSLSPPAGHAPLARAVAADIALAATLRAPALHHSVAAEVASAVALAAQLPTPSLPRSVAAAVVAEMQGARLLRALPTAQPPGSVAAAVVSDLSWGTRLAGSPAALPRSVAASVVSRVQEESVSVYSQPVPSQAAASALLAPTPSGWRTPLVPRHNPAPMVLVVALMVGLTLLAVTTAWPNLAAGALVLRTLVAQVSPLAGVGVLLLLLTSALVTWRPRPAVQWAGAGAFALSALLTLPAVADVAARGDVHFGRNVTVSGVVSGNVIAVGGNIDLLPGARVDGEVVTLLGDVHRNPGAQVAGHVSALLGRVPGNPDAIQTAPPDGIGMASAAAFRPVLGWLGSAAWPQVFMTLTGGALLLLFVAGLAPMLAHRQRHAPIRTLALGVLALAALLLPAFLLAVTGLLGPALIACALTGVLLALGLSVSAYDAGRTVARRLKLPVPDAVGALLGLSAVAATLGEPPLALSVALVGGAWGAGTLLLTRGARAT
ncbi:polymer-forming cytoskeletal protein [Deinococcus sp.]|uniref:polymer-forming cytoskeletal protein n=1 Tax=Deinococcus sp. TaxID=47478 RepID=UPI002869B8A0|nr:polymer-forming cytoskeletal protein [Deinococcus sp.]